MKVLDEAVTENVVSSKKRGQKKGLGHVRPDVTMLDRERQLLRIATRGGVWGVGEGAVWGWEWSVDEAVWSAVVMKYWRNAVRELF